MTQRTPTIVPFAILIVVSAALVPSLPRAVAFHNAFWATLLLVAATLITAASLLLARRLRQFPTVLAPALWLTPALLFAFESNVLALLCLAPAALALRNFLPASPPPSAHAFLSALLLQAGIVMHVSGRPLLALVPAFFGIALVLWAKEPPAKPRDLRWLSICCAVLLTYAILTPRGFGLPGDGAFELTQIIAAPDPTNQGGKSEDAHLGLILRPRLKAEERKLPPPPKLTIQSLRQIPATPIDIPFSGVYWLFQVPLDAPPANSPVIEASLGDGKYRSDDMTPLRMHARQSFSTPFPARRLSAIEVTLVSNDIYPSTLSMELFAVDSKGPRSQMWLGRQPIQFLPAPQTLSFKVPPAPVVDPFDELQLRVYLTQPRLHIAPRITIQKFRLYPR